jgi:hypothetical protein
LTAVAVWDHKPSADELLHWRLAGGWQPLTSCLKGGPRIDGHAACLMPAPAP